MKKPKGLSSSGQVKVKSPVPKSNSSKGMKLTKPGKGK